jgi:hypothetical protein
MSEEQREKRELLDGLYQLDEDIYSLDERESLLVSKLFHSMEDFYHLREGIKSVIDERQVEKTEVENFFARMIDDIFDEGGSTRNIRNKAQSRRSKKFSRILFELPEVIKLHLQK